jgi:hypothetical protein
MFAVRCVVRAVRGACGGTVAAGRDALEAEASEVDRFLSQLHEIEAGHSHVRSPVVVY